MERQDIPTIDIEQDMGISKEDGTLEVVEQIIDPDVPYLAGEELPVIIFPANIATPEETPGVRRSSPVILQTKPEYIPSISCKQYETINTQLKCEEIFHPDAHVFLFQ